MDNTDKTKKDLILGVSTFLIISFSILFGSVIFYFTGKISDAWITGSVIALVSGIVLLTGDYLE